MHASRWHWTGCPTQHPSSIAASSIQHTTPPLYSKRALVITAGAQVTTEAGSEALCSNLQLAIMFVVLANKSPGCSGLLSDICFCCCSLLLPAAAAALLLVHKQHTSATGACQHRGGVERSAQQLQHEGKPTGQRKQRQQAGRQGLAMDLLLTTAAAATVLWPG